MLKFSQTFPVIVLSVNRFHTAVTNFQQKLSTRNLNNHKNKSSSLHILNNLYHWKTKQEFVEYLAASVLFNKDGLIAINKPYGVPLKKSEQADCDSKHQQYSIEDALVPLASLLNVKTLIPAKMTERFSSGVSLLASQEEIISKIIHSYNVNKSKKIQTFKYLALTIGEPKPKESSLITIGLGNYEHENFPAKKLPIVIKHYSNRQVAAGLVHEFKVDYKLISSGDEQCSLVEVNTSSLKNSFLRVFLAHTLSPILGDHLYGNRVQDVLGKRLAISPIQAENLASFQKISPNILARLKVNESGRVPTCLHLSQLTLSQFWGKHSDLTIKAEPPPHFRYSCHALGVHLPTIDTPEMQE